LQRPLAEQWPCCAVRTDGMGELAMLRQNEMILNFTI